MIVHDGPSMLDGSPILGIVTATTLNSKLVGPTKRAKPCLQLWILLRDTHPLDALHSGEDAAICGACPLRAGEDTARICYVSAQPIGAVYRTYLRGSYPRVSPSTVTRHAWAPLLRLGAYGDPAALPFHVVSALTDACKQAHTGVVGYTHQWRICDQRFSELLMASCDSAEDALAAQAAGWRTFSVKLPGEEMAGIACPAESGKTTCSKCKLCDGSRGPSDRRKNIYIDLHGAPAQMRQRTDAFRKLKEIEQP